MPVTRSTTKTTKGNESMVSNVSAESDVPTTSRQKRQDKQNAVRNLQDNDVSVNTMPVTDNVDSHNNLVVDRDSQVTPEAQEVVEENSTVQ